MKAKTPGSAERAELVPVDEVEVLPARPRPAPGNVFKSIKDLEGRAQAEALIKAWLSDMKETTRKAYLGDLRRFALFMAELAGHDVNPHDMEAVKLASLDAVLELISNRGKARELLLAYKASLGQRQNQSINAKPGDTVHDAAVSRYLNCLKSVIVAAADHDVIEWTLRFKVKQPQGYRDTRGPDDQVITQVFEYLDSELALSAGDEDDERDVLRDYSIVRLMLTSGLRRVEVQTLDVEHLGLDELKVYILGKARTEREHAPISEETATILKRWVTLREKAVGKAGGPLFVSFDHRNRHGRLSLQSISDTIARVRDLSGVDKLRCHGLRHRAITDVAREHGLLAAQSFARHKDTKTTINYIDNLKEHAVIGVQAIEKKLAELRKKRG